MIAHQVTIQKCSRMFEKVLEGSRRYPKSGVLYVWYPKYPKWGTSGVPKRGPPHFWIFLYYAPNLTFAPSSGANVVWTNVVMTVGICAKCLQEANFKVGSKTVQ